MTSLTRRFAQSLRGAATVILLLGGAAWAQAPQASLSMSFLQPFGVVAPTDIIPVEVRFSNNDPSLDFVVDSSLPFGGLDAGLVPAQGQYWDAASQQYLFAPFASYSSFSLTIGFGCSGSFTNGCSWTPYNFEFAPNPFANPYRLAAGAHQDYLFGTFVPAGGPVPAGTYEFYRSVVWMDVKGHADDGRELFTVVFPAATCWGDSAAACADVGFFTRVVAVPEPQTALLSLLGLAALAWRLRRHG